MPTKSLGVNIGALIITGSLVYEILGKYFMGVDLDFNHLPSRQPEKHLVKNPTKSIQFFQKAIELDRLGLGAIAPFANALHAAGQEEKATRLYQTICDTLKNSTEVKSSMTASWVWTRLGQQQLHHDNQHGNCLQLCLNFNMLNYISTTNRRTMAS